MNKYILILFLIPLVSFGQRGGGKGGSGDFSGFGKKNKSSYFRGNVSGKIIDSKTGEGLEYANISITNAKWNKVIEGTISGQNGKFSMSGVLTGEYILKINYLGYKAKEVEFNLTKKDPCLFSYLSIHKSLVSKESNKRSSGFLNRNLEFNLSSKSEYLLKAVVR